MAELYNFIRCVQALIETLGFRHIGVVRDEYAISPDGMKMFGVLDLETEMQGYRSTLLAPSTIFTSSRLWLLIGECTSDRALRQEFESFHPPVTTYRQYF